MTMPLHAPDRTIGTLAPGSAAPRPATFAGSSGSTGLSEGVLLAIIVSTMLAVFVFDILTPPDDVSIPFIYTIPIFLSLFSRYKLSYACAAAAALLSVVGSFIQPPREVFDFVFLTNRGIAIGAQWLIAFLVAMRKDAEARMSADFEAERTKAEISRRFIDVLSHEIGTSLTTIDGQAFRIRKLSADGADSDLGARAEKIRKAVRRVEAVVRQVQLVSEVGEGAIACHPEALSLEELLKDALLDSGDSHPVTMDFSSLPETIYADPDLIRQTFENLLSNAIKYSPPGSPIELHGTVEAGHVVLTITDHGRGIGADELAKLGQPYFRGRNSQGIHGTGIGLYVAKRFAACHGGALDIRSTPGQGTAVTLRIPVGGAGAEIAP